MGSAAFLRSHPSSAQPSLNNSLYSRDDIPQVPDRPAGSGPNSFHEIQFEFLQETGFGPAVDAMPVFLYSRTTKAFVSYLEVRSSFGGI